MNAAINTNPLYNLARRNHRASICPVGQADQADVNALKLGNVLRQSNRRQAAPAPRRNFQTVWAAPAYAATA